MDSHKIKFLNLQEHLQSRQFNHLWVEDSFNNHRCKKKILAPMPDSDAYFAQKEKEKKISKDVPIEFKFMTATPFLTKEQEQHIFRKYNYLKYKFKSLIESQNLATVKPNVVKEAEEYWIAMQEQKQLIVFSHGRLVMNLVKKNNCIDLISSCSDGCYGLVVAVDYFDYRTRIKFSTYAWWVITDFIRKNKISEWKAFTSCMTNIDDQLDEKPTKEFDAVGHNENKKVLEEKLRYATERERTVLKHFYGINTEKLTLDKISKIMRVTKERIRQIKEAGIRRIQLCSK